MKRFFSTFLLLTLVASSLIISNNYYKQNNAQISAQRPNELKKSIELTEADVYESKRNTVFVNMSNY